MKEQVRLLRRHGLHIDLVYADLNLAYLSQRQWSRRELLTSDQNGNKDMVISGPTFPKNNRWGFSKWVNDYKKYILRFIEDYGRPDLIHGHTYLGGIVANEVNKVLSIPFVITEHYTGWLDLSIRSLHKDLAHQAFQNANLITAVSHSLALALNRNSNYEIKVVPNFIDTELFKYHEGVHREGSKLIMIGELIARKQIDHGIQLLATMIQEGYELTLTIVGAGPLESSVKLLSKQLKVDHVIKWTGRLTASQVAEELRDSDVLIHTSKLETFGLVMIEALCMGVPIVTYENGGVDEMRDLFGVYVSDNMEVRSLNGLVKQVLEEAPDQDSQSISRLARRRFGADSVVEQWKKVYEDMILTYD